MWSARLENCRRYFDVLIVRSCRSYNVHTPSVQPASSLSSCSGSGRVFTAPPDAPAEAAVLPPGAGSARGGRGSNDHEWRCD